MAQIEATISRTGPFGLNYDDFPIVVDYSIEDGEVYINTANALENVPYRNEQGRELPPPYFITKGEYIDLTSPESLAIEERIYSDEAGSRSDNAYENYKDKYF